MSTTNIKKKNLKNLGTFAEIKNTQKKKIKKNFTPHKVFIINNFHPFRIKDANWIKILRMSTPPLLLKLYTRTFEIILLNGDTVGAARCHIYYGYNVKFPFFCCCTKTSMVIKNKILLSKYLHRTYYHHHLSVSTNFKQI